MIINCSTIAYKIIVSGEPGGWVVIKINDFQKTIKQNPKNDESIFLRSFFHHAGDDAMGRKIFHVKEITFCWDFTQFIRQNVRPILIQNYTPRQEIMITD